MKKIIALALVFLSCCHSSFGESPYPLAWTQQFGTSGIDFAYSIAVDVAGNTYVTGLTDPTFTFVGADAYLAKFDSSGNELWIQLLGTSSFDQGLSVASDSSGNVYIAGSTQGDLEGSNSGGTDAYVMKLDSSGNEIWTRQFGTSAFDLATSVAVDNVGNVFVGGSTEGALAGTNSGGFDAFLSKYDSAGNHTWTQQLGTSLSDFGQGVAIDGAGGAYVTGSTQGALEGTNAGIDDAYIARYDTSGNALWIEQIGSSDSDQSFSVAADGVGNAYISGLTRGNLGGTNAGFDDAFLTKFDGAGNEFWTKQIGTTATDISYAVAVDGAGHPYISGVTQGNLGGTNSGLNDAFLTKVDKTTGVERWTQQIGTSDSDESQSVAIDATGNAYIAGITSGSLEGTNAGAMDGFVAKFSEPVPEPSMAALWMLGWAYLAIRRRLV